MLISKAKDLRNLISLTLSNSALLTEKKLGFISTKQVYKVQIKIEETLVILTLHFILRRGLCFDLKLNSKSH
jgi:hypothetical protein